MTQDHEKLREAIAKLKECFRFNVDAQSLTRPYRDEVAAAALLVWTAAESTLPKTKMVEVWRVEFARAEQLEPAKFSAEIWNYDSEALARDAAKNLAGEDWAHKYKARCQCIRVTGPHQQEVPT